MADKVIGHVLSQLMTKNSVPLYTPEVTEYNMCIEFVSLLIY